MALLLGLSIFGYSQQHYPLNNYIGAVGHPWDMGASYAESNKDAKTYRLQTSLTGLGLSRFRVYSDVYADKDEQNLLYRFSPEGRGYLVDEYIRSLHTMSPLEILFSYQGAPKNIQSEWDAAGYRSTQYRRYGSDPMLASTYTEMAHDIAVLTRRGGNNALVPDYPLFIPYNWWDPVQIMYKGMGFYKRIELGNEWDNRWSNTYPMTGAMYAVMWSICYDSAKKVDPTMEVHTTGLCEADPKTLTDAWAWVNQNRGGRFPADAIQVHSYPWAWSLGLSGGLPGELSIIPEVKAMVVAANGVPVEVGEWSWDVHQDSPINAPPHDGYLAEVVRGQLAIRTMIKFSQIGVRAAYWYRINQDYFPADPTGGNYANDHNGTQFATSALRRQVDDDCHFVYTTVGDYFRQLQHFKDYTWSSAQRDDTVQVHTLMAPGQPSAQALWTVEKIIPYADSRGVSHPAFKERRYEYFLPVGTIYRFANDSSGQLVQEKHLVGNITLTSSPIFFLADPVMAPLPVKLYEFTAVKSGNTALLNWRQEGADHILVERATDGTSFSTLASTKQSSYTDRTPAPINYYRLKLVEADGSFSYSSIQAVRFGKYNSPKYMVTTDILGRVVDKGYYTETKAVQLHGPGIYMITTFDNNIKVTETVRRY